MLANRLKIALGLIASVAAIGPVNAAPASRFVSSSVSVKVRPESAMVLNGSVVELKLRLAGGTSAAIWMDDSCVQIPDRAVQIPDDARVVTASGSYHLPVKVISSKHAGCIRFRSSDGQLNQWIAFSPEKP